MPWNDPFLHVKYLIRLWTSPIAPDGWGAPKDEEVRSWVFAHVSSFRTCLYGRKVYETMLYWETAHTIPDQPQFVIDFARQWQAAEKIVYSKTLAGPRSSRTRIERSFDPEMVRKLKANAEDDIAVAGPELAGQTIEAGLVDELQMRVCPVVIGGGKPYFPRGVRPDLELVEERRFRNGEIFLRYAVCGPSK